MYLCPQSFRVIVQFSTHVLELLHDKTGMMKEAVPAAVSSTPRRFLTRSGVPRSISMSRICSLAEARVYVGAKGPAGDVRGVRHVQEQAKVSEIKSLSHRMGAFSLA